MKHLGDITKISGRDAPTVNVIIGGSPCQDLSIAGKRAGLGGQRSGLYMEQIRIIKEMREKDAESGRTGADIRPRFMVWENVPGAFSVNGGRDFAAVLEETIRVVDEEAPDILPPAKGWTNSGCYMGDGWSVAWRVLDAQFWGVPQRRRRIALVADFGGECAPEILFERESVSRHSESGETARKGTAGYAADCAGTAISFLERAGCAGGGKGILIQDEQAGTLSTVNNQSVCYPINTMVASRNNDESRTTFGVGDNGEAQFTLSAAHEHAVCYEPASAMEENWRESDVKNALRAEQSKSNHAIVYPEVSRTLDNNCGNPACNQGGIAVVEQETASGVICLNPHDSQSARVYDAKGVWHSHTVDRPAVCYQSHHMDARYTDMGDTAETVCARYGTGGNNQPLVCMGYMSFGEYVETETWKALLARDDITTSDLCCVTFNGQTCGTLDAHYAQCPGAMGGVERDVVAVDCRNGTESETNGTLQAKENGGTSLNLNNVCGDRYIVRRLTPLECTRLQGYPDGWVDIGDWTDSKGKRHKDSDSAKYKALGNSIAIPPWLWVLSRLNAYCDEKTIASLFDGIGGFPLIWEFLNGKGSAVWCSEIEEFPIAVTKRRFGDE